MPSQVAVREAGAQVVGEWKEKVAPSALANRYRLDPLAQLEDGHASIFDVETLEVVKFEPYQHQIEVVEAWVDLDHLARTSKAHPELAELRFRNSLEEKSRQMGITWIVAWVFHWTLAWWPVSGLALHLNLSEIDDGGRASTVDSLFGKIRWLNESVPAAWRPKLIFRQKPSIITNARLAGAFAVGEGATPDPGRGGKYKYGFIDEAARIAFGEAAHAALSRAIPKGRLYNSTPFGEGNVYYRLTKDRPKSYTFRRHHWSEHPVYSAGLHVAASKDVPYPDQPTPAADKIGRKCPLCKANRRGVRWNAENPVCHRYPGKLTSPWYDEAVLELTDQQVAAELDIDYQASLTARVYPEFTEDVHVVEEGIPYDEALELSFALDYGTDTTAVLILQESPWDIRAIGELEMGSETPDGREAIPDTVVPALIEVLADLGVPLILLEKEWLLQMLAVGDPAGEGKDLATGKPLTAHYRRHGLAIKSPRRYSVAKTITAFKRLLMGLPKPFRVSGPTCPGFISHAKNNRWPTDRQGVRTASSLPKDDKHNHIMRAAAYWTAYRFPPRDDDGDDAGDSGDAVAEATRRLSGQVSHGNVPSAVDVPRPDSTGRHTKATPGMKL